MHNVRHHLNTLALKIGWHWRLGSVKGLSPDTNEKIYGRPTGLKYKLKVPK
jgi:hypothetical protein